MYEEILKKYGLKFEDLNAAERETLNTMLQAIQKNELTIGKIKEYIALMKDAVSQELEEQPEYIRFFIFKIENRKQILLKARLRNYRLLGAMLESPEKAKNALHEALSNIQVK